MINDVAPDEVVGANLIAPVSASELLFAVLAVGVHFFVTLNLVDPGGQDSQCFFLVLTLIASVNEHAQSGRFVLHAYCGSHLVDVLTARFLFAGLENDFQVIFTKLFFLIFRRQRKHGYGNDGGLTPAASFGRWYALYAVFPRFIPEGLPDTFTGELDDRVTDFFVQDFDLETARCAVLDVRG